MTLSLFTRRHISKKNNTPRKGSWKPSLEALEDRVVLSGFSDGFEGTQLDSFWSINAQSGSITFPSTGQVHTGQQSVQFNSASTSQQKEIWLYHDFPQPVYGRFSVWIYDTGANRSSSNYIAMYVSNSNSYATLSAFDYNFADARNYRGGTPTDGFDSGVLRTEAWHQFEITLTPDSTSYAIDGTNVHTGPSMTVDRVTLALSGPFWRPAWTAYFDDFEFAPFAQTDIAATSLTWNATQGGVDFSYEVTGADLTQSTTAALYWSTDATFDSQIDTLIYDTPIERQVGQHGPFYLPNTVLGTPPSGATHLLLVTDPPSATMPNGLIDESDETNNVLALAIPDIIVHSATTQDSRTVTITYEVLGADLDTVPLRIYRSANAQIEPGLDDVIPLANPAAILPATVGQHTVTLHLAEPLRIIPSQPYILIQADPDGTAIETIEETNPLTNNEASFRKRVLGVVTHGFNLVGFTRFGFTAWITNLAADLRNSQMYDRTVAFDWNSTSFLPIPGMTEQAGRDMALRVESETAQMKARWPDDIVDVHFIGHSRGSVVISQALQNLVNHSEVTRGYAKMTMLDPHPAHNHPLDPQYSVIPAAIPGLGRLGQLAEGFLLGFQAIADDPEVHIPHNVDEAEVFYQHTPWYAARGMERILNLWGEVPVLNLSGQPVNYYDLSGVLRMSHTEVVNWYQKNVVGTLKNGLPPPSPSSVSPALVTTIPATAFDAASFNNSVLPILAKRSNAALNAASRADVLAASRDAVFSILKAASQPSQASMAASPQFTANRETVIRESVTQRDEQQSLSTVMTPSPASEFRTARKILSPGKLHSSFPQFAYFDCASCCKCLSCKELVSIVSL